MAECLSPLGTHRTAGRSEPLKRGGQLVPGASGTGPIRVYSELAPNDHLQRVSFRSARISPSSRTTFRRSSGHIVSMSMMSAQSSPCPSR
jgi:hypothetical protein